jgi:hypothetical protein
MAMSTTAKLLTSVGLGVGAAIVTNGVIRQQAETQDATDATKPNFWFRYAPWISMAGPAAAVPANDYVLTNLRKVPVTTIPMDVATDGLRGVAQVKQFAAAR